MLLQVARPFDPMPLDPGTVGGMFAGLARAAAGAGFEVSAFEGYGVRLPLQPSQEHRWTAWRTLVGVSGGIRFTARTDDDGWHVVLWRPGWPTDAKATTTTLRRLFAAWTPERIRAAGRTR